MGTRCAGCNAGFSEGDTIATCCVCMGLFHCNEKSTDGSGLNCSAAIASEIRVIRLKTRGLMVYRCKECTSNGGDSPRLVEVISRLQASVDKLSSISGDIESLTRVEIPKLKSSVADLETSLKTLNGKVEDHIGACSLEIESMKKDYVKLQEDLAAHGNVVIPQCVSSVSTNVVGNTQLVLDEVDNRKKRENNILILNVPEQILNTGESLKIDYDLEHVKSVLCGIQNINTSLNVMKLKRLGAFNANKVRPILVRFDSRSDVINVLTNWRLIPKPYLVLYDLTKCQREHFNHLKKEAKIFNESEENQRRSLMQIVKFRNGNPFIFTTKINPKKVGALRNALNSSLADAPKNI